MLAESHGMVGYAFPPLASCNEIYLLITRESCWMSHIWHALALCVPGTESSLVMHILSTGKGSHVCECMSYPPFCELWAFHPYSQIEGGELDAPTLVGERHEAEVAMFCSQTPSLRKKRRWLVYKCDYLAGRGIGRLWNGYRTFRWAQGEATVYFRSLGAES